MDWSSGIGPSFPGLIVMIPHIRSKKKVLGVSNQTGHLPQLQFTKYLVIVSPVIELVPSLQLLLYMTCVKKKKLFFSWLTSLACLVLSGYNQRSRYKFKVDINDQFQYRRCNMFFKVSTISASSATLSLHKHITCLISYM